MTIQLQSQRPQSCNITIYDESGRFAQNIYAVSVAHGTKEVTCELPTDVYFLKVKDEKTAKIK